MGAGNFLPSSPGMLMVWLIVMECQGVLLWLRWCLLGASNLMVECRSSGNGRQIFGPMSRLHMRRGARKHFAEDLLRTA